MQKLTKKDDKGYKLVLKNAVEIVTEDAKRWSISTSTTGTKTIRGYAVDKLAQYEELEEQGLLLKLPCKVGDIVYRIDTDPQIESREIETCVVKNIAICENGEILLKADDNDDTICDLESLVNGKLYLDFYRVFLTRSEAERMIL